MNKISMELAIFFLNYQKKRNGKVHPKEVIISLEETLKEWKFCYGDKGEKSKYCKIDGYYCECNK